jgi:NAD(P)-dependent dehydrogenase (short-subunit alcohol dehydrogenase family)
MENRMRFNKKHILITGAARGIGFEIARHFAMEGANLSLLDYNEENLSKATEELRTERLAIWPYNIDVSNRVSVFETVKEGRCRAAH